MPKSIDIAKYPPGMLEVLESVCYTGQPCPITYPNTMLAQKERFDFYGLVRAIKVTNHSLKAHVVDLVFSLDGEAKNILVISKGQRVKDSFYAQVAETHRNKNGAEAPSLADQAAAAVAAAEAAKNKQA